MPSEPMFDPKHGPMSRFAHRLDGRGLLPLDEARRIVAAATEYAVGREWHEGPHGPWKDSDLLWAALLSLADAQEFAREATRLVWRYGPRGFDSNLDPFARYGAGVLAWVEANLSAGGDLPGLPQNIGSCLLEVAGPDAYRIVGRVRRIGGGEAPATLLRNEWIRRHPGSALVAAAGPGAVGTAWSDEVLARACAIGLPIPGEAPPRVSAEAILDQLDRNFEAAQGGALTWPYHGIYDHGLCGHGMRLFAATVPAQGRWCVVIETLSGTYPEIFGISRNVYGSPAIATEMAPGLEPVVTGVSPEDAENDPDTDVVLAGGAGEFRLGPRDLDDPTLAPEGRDPREAPMTSRLRLYARRFRPRMWTPASTLMETHLGAVDAVVIADTDRFHHDDMDVPPSGQPTYASLARALAAADPSLFEPGEPNTWFDDAERRSLDG